MVISGSRDPRGGGGDGVGGSCFKLTYFKRL